jgi:hypothetical protein
MGFFIFVILKTCFHRMKKIKKLSHVVVSVIFDCNTPPYGSPKVIQ